MAIRALAADECDLLRRVAAIHVSVPATWWPDYRPEAAAAEETSGEDARLIRAGDGAVLVAAEADRLDGFVRVHARGAGEAHVTSLWVAEGLRRRGLGAALLDAAAAWAAAKGCRELTSEVHVGNPAMLALSARCGFEPQWQSFAKRIG